MLNARNKKLANALKFWYQIQIPIVLSSNPKTH